MLNIQDSEETSLEKMMMPALDSLMSMDVEFEKARELAPIEENPAADVQDSHMEKETPEDRQVIPIITPSRWSRRLEEKRGRQ